MHTHRWIHCWMLALAAGLLAGGAAQAADAEPSPAWSEIEWSVADGELPGVLTLPAGAGPFPAVVMVHGSGPGDRDQTLGPNKPFRDLAHGLAAHGVASLRYDKRTRIQPEHFADRSFTVQEEVVSDAVAALAELASHPDVDGERVHVLGLSLGAMLAPRIARDSDVAGMILVSAPARPLHELVVEQVEYLVSLQTDEATRRLAEAQLEGIRGLSDQIAALEPGDDSTGHILGAPPSYWLDLRGYDPVAAAARLRTPLLLLHGGRDYQVTDADFQRWQDAFTDVPRAQLVYIETLNHVMMPGEGRATPQEYMQPGVVHPGVPELIAEWIRDQ